jgi:hypothetical protein
VTLSMTPSNSNEVVLGEETRGGISLDPGDKKRFQIVYSVEDSPVFSFYKLSIEERSLSVVETETPATPQRQLVKLLNDTSFTSENYTGVKGVVKNTSGQKLPIVQVEVTFLDKSGAIASQQTKSFTEFPAGEKRRFKIEYQGFGSWKRYKLKVLVKK